MAVIQTDYPSRVAALLNDFGIPPDYAERRQLTLQLEAEELVSIGKADAGRDCLLDPSAARAWMAMRARAEAQGIILIPLSGFRSVERQAEMIRGKLALGEKIDEILESIAAPGYSEHHTGRAIDVGTIGVLPLEEAFATTAAYAWMARHGDSFGYRLSYPRNNRSGFIYEPWHWCWEKD